MAEDWVSSPAAVSTGLVAVHTMAIGSSAAEAPPGGSWGVKTQLPGGEEGPQVTKVQLMPGGGLVSVTEQVRVNSRLPSVTKVAGPRMVVLASNGPSGWRRQTGREIDREVDRQTDRQRGRQADRQRERQTGRQTERQRGRQTYRQRDRQTDRQTDRETDRQRDRQTDREIDSQTER